MLYLLANDGRLSGRASGNVYQRNGRVRGFVVPSLVQNAATSAARSRLGNNSSDWNSISELERGSWSNANGFSTSDRFGRIVPLKGKALFVSLNSNLEAAGVAKITVAPLPAAVPSLLSLAIADFSIAAGALRLAFAPTPSPAGAANLVFATACQSAGTNKPSASKYRLIDVMPSGTASSFDVAALYLAKFGAPTVGGKIFVKVLSINTTTGQAGIPIFVQVNVVV